MLSKSELFAQGVAGPMDNLLYQFQLNLTTWTYLTSLLTLAIYFKFNRLWSVRNLDLFGLIALAPGLLLIEQSGAARQVGWIWLFVVGALFLLRLLADPMMVRRPLLEPNMTTGGLLFIAVCLLTFLIVNVLTGRPTTAAFDVAAPTAALPDVDAMEPLDIAVAIEPPPSVEDGATESAASTPGHPWLQALPNISSRDSVQLGDDGPDPAQVATSRTLAICSHLAIVLGMVLIAVRHFDNVRTGIAAATLYLLLPYTAQMTGRVDHLAPAALIIWAVLAYRHPLISGSLLGLAGGAAFYPLFALPLWLGFYWQRGMVRFLLGFAAALALLVASLALLTSDTASFLALARQMFAITSFSLQAADGFWAMSDSIAPYRIPVLVLFVVMCASFALWPAPKNLGTLMSCSGAVMLGTQFWHAREGGLFVAWYLPLLLLVIFRPNLEDRVAITTLNLGWLARRRWQPKTRAA